MTSRKFAEALASGCRIAEDQGIAKWSSIPGVKVTKTTSTLLADRSQLVQMEMAVPHAAINDAGEAVVDEDGDPVTAGYDIFLVTVCPMGHVKEVADGA